MPLSPHFIIQEFVPKAVYAAFGDSSLWFIDSKLISVCELIRAHFDKPVTINDWHKGGTYYESGYRTPESPTGAKYSQHRFGRAADIKLEGLTSEEVYNEILSNEALFLMAGLSAMENIAKTATWVHVDVRNNGKADKILIVNP